MIRLISNVVAFRRIEMGNETRPEPLRYAKSFLFAKFAATLATADPACFR